MTSKSNNRPFAIITGGSSGIGLEMARILAKKEYDLFIVSNQKELLENVKSELENNYNISCYTLNLDLSNPNSAQILYNHCKENNWVIDTLINNAGMLVFSEVIATNTKRIETILQLHINTPSLLCRYFGEDMKNRGKGNILNISSISSVMPYPGISLYGPSKTYMRYFTRAFRSEMKIFGVNVTCLLPGATETGLYDPNRINLKLAKRLGIMQTANFVAKKAINALLKNRKECIPGVINKLTVFFLPIVPSWIIYQIHKRTGIIKKGSQALD